MDAVEAALNARKSGGSPRAGKPVLVDTFLSAVRALGDNTPSDHDLEVTRRYLGVLTEQTAVDHLKSVDEMLQQVPTEFQAATKTLAEAEAFIFAAASGQVDKVVKALDRDWDLVHAIDRDGHTALHAAAAQGNVEVCTTLLSRGSNASVQDYEGFTPIHWAVESNAPDVVTLLLAHGADTSVKNNAGFTAYDMIHMLKPKHQTTMFGLLSDPRRASVAAGAGATGAPSSPSHRAVDKEAMTLTRAAGGAR